MVGANFPCAVEWLKLNLFRTVGRRSSRTHVKIKYPITPRNPYRLSSFAGRRIAKQNKIEWSWSHEGETLRAAAISRVTSAIGGVPSTSKNRVVFFK